jgi:hypothetical protein
MDRFLAGLRVKRKMCLQAISEGVSLQERTEKAFRAGTICSEWEAVAPESQPSNMAIEFASLPTEFAPVWRDCLKVLSQATL